MFFSNLYYILTEIVSSYFCKSKITINKYAKVSIKPISLDGYKAFLDIPIKID